MRTLTLCLFLVGCGSGPTEKPHTAERARVSSPNIEKARELKVMGGYKEVTEIRESDLENWRQRLEAGHGITQNFCDGTSATSVLPATIEKGGAIRITDVVHYMLEGQGYGEGCLVRSGQLVGCADVSEYKGVWFIVTLPDLITPPFPCFERVVEDR